MAVKASPEGVKKMEEKISNKRDETKKALIPRSKVFNNMAYKLNINEATIKKFVFGKDGVKKDNAIAIIEHLGFKREDIITKEEWDKDLPQASLADLWQEIYNLAVYTPQRLGFVKEKKIDRLGIHNEIENKYLTKVVCKTPVWLEMEVQVAGVLILLDRDDTGDIVALSPSPYIPDANISIGTQWFPLQDSSKESFKPANPSTEEFVAIVLPQLPSFDWLDVGDKCAQLEAEQMQELLNYIKEHPPLETIRSQVKIVAA
jgi:hypothetical protein